MSVRRRPPSARGAEHEPRDERQPDALDLGLRHAADVGEQHDRDRAADQPGNRRAAQAGRARRRRPGRSRGPRPRGSRAGSSRTDGGRDAGEVLRAGRGEARPPREPGRPRPRARRRDVDAGDDERRSRRRCDRDRRAGSPRAARGRTRGTRWPRTRDRRARRARRRAGPSRPVASTRARPRPRYPAKNASPDVHQIAAGVSTRNGAAARASASPATSRTATSVGDHARHRRRRSTSDGVRSEAAEAEPGASSRAPRPCPADGPACGCCTRQPIGERPEERTEVVDARHRADVLLREQRVGEREPAVDQRERDRPQHGRRRDDRQQQPPRHPSGRRTAAPRSGTAADADGGQHRAARPPVRAAAQRRRVDLHAHAVGEQCLTPLRRDHHDGDATDERCRPSTHATRAVDACRRCGHGGGSIGDRWRTGDQRSAPPGEGNRGSPNRARRATRRVSRFVSGRTVSCGARRRYVRPRDRRRPPRARRSRRDPARPARRSPPATGRSSSTTARPTAPPRSPRRSARASSTSRGAASGAPATPACSPPSTTSCASWTATARSTVPTSPVVSDPVGGGLADLVLGAASPDAARGRCTRASRTGSSPPRSAGAPASRLRDLGPMRGGAADRAARARHRDRRFGWPLEMVLRAAGRGWRIPRSTSPTGRGSASSKVTGTVRGTARTVHDMAAVLR